MVFLIYSVCWFCFVFLLVLFKKVCKDYIIHWWILGSQWFSLTTFLVRYVTQLPGT